MGQFSDGVCGHRTRRAGGVDVVALRRGFEKEESICGCERPQVTVGHSDTIYKIFFQPLYTIYLPNYLSASHTLENTSHRSS